MSNSFSTHGLQHAKPLCPSSTPGVHSNSHPLSRWCHPPISSSVVPSSSCPQSLPASESFPMSQLLLTQGLVKAMVFPVVMYGCESWTVKKAECWRIDAFELWCWRRLLRVPWTTRRSSQSILKEISPEYSLEGLMLKLKLQYFDYLMQRTD